MKARLATGLASSLLAALLATTAAAQTFDVPTFAVGSPTFSASLQDLKLAPQADGGFVVVWFEFNGPPDPNNAVVTHRFSRSGVAVAPPVRIDATGYGLYPSITADLDGGFIGAWMWSNVKVARALYARRLDGNGHPVSTEARIDIPFTGPMIAHAVTYRDSGPVYAYKQNGIFVRGYDKFGKGTTLATKVADNTPAFEIGIATLPGDRFVVSWTNLWLGDWSWGRIYNADFTPATDAFPVDTAGIVDVVRTSRSGEISFVGHANYDDTNGGAAGPRSETWIHRFSADGTPLGDRQVVRTAAAGMLNLADAAYDSHGSLFVVWREYDSIANQLEVARARAYAPGGLPLGPDFAVSDTPVDEIRTVALKDDCFANGWYAYSRAYANVVCLCGSGTCGDGSVDPSCEICDDGNSVNGDGCDNNCTPSACGNGMLDASETCDDGNLANGDGCDSNCTVTACGNGIVTAGEQCDDGNSVDGDGCDSDCRVSGCGNGHVSGGEECDDGNTVNGDGCDKNCTVSRCGNGIRGGTEACDDGNSVNGDGCDNNCTVSACGNGIVVGEEECDDGNRTGGDGCDANCLIESCGNGRQESNEQCDPLGAPASGPGACNPDCTLRAVHDSVVLPLDPIRLSIPVGNDPFTSNVVVQVQNADVNPVRESPGHAIRLVASDGDCPAGTVTGQPDFDRGTPGVQDTTVVDGGLPSTAIAQVTVSRDTFAPFNRSIPTRCTLWFTASEATGSSDDPTPDNNQIAVELDVTDTGDSQNSGLDEFFVDSMSPMTVKIPPGQLVVTKELKPVVRRSKDLPADAPSLDVTISASDGDCPAGTVGFIDMDRRVAGNQTHLMLRRGRRAKGSLGLIVRADAFTSPSDESPRRCTALITATGVGDTDPSNNTTRLVVDVVDRNDF